MTLPEDTWSIGIDIGTASIRTCVTIGNGLVTSLSEDFINRVHHVDHQEFITQSSTQMWNFIKESIKRLLPRANKRVGTIRGIGVDATCSLVVLRRTGNGKLVPYPVDFGFNTKEQNVVLWMDHRSTKELQILNEVCKDEPFMSKIGGSFLPEMGVPKLKFLIDRIPAADLPDLLFMELHDFVSIMLQTNGDLNLYQVNNEYNDWSHNLSEIALDGSTKGWSRRLLDKFGLSILSEQNFKMIGRLESDILKDHHQLPLPYAGSRIGIVCDSFKKEIGLPMDERIYIGHGVIDCYAGWISTVKEIDTTLSMVAGTSTCYLIATKDSKSSVPGVWGPFNNFVKGHYISELGLSATGALIEHLFKSHPAHEELVTCTRNNRTTIFNMLDQIIDQLTKESNLPLANYLVKHKFLYGNILGNRTPYADPQMKGLFIGESSDLSIKDLALKYLTVLEFLALETRQVVSTLEEGGYTINKISMSGSQFNNKRLVMMIEAATGKEVVSYQAQQPLFTVVRGASMLGFAAAHNKDVCDIMNEINTPQKQQGKQQVPKDLISLLDVKYKIMVDMAQSQIKYRKLVDNIVK